MSKLINPSKKKRKLCFEESPDRSGGGFNMGPHKTSKENSRRINVLNTLFMKQISDILVTGNIAGDVLGKGLEISRVAMAPDFHQLNVYWISKKEENAIALDESLPQLGFTLRHELSQLGVMGVVPRIVFVKDKDLATAITVDYLLTKADFGEDHKPLEQISEFKDVPIVHNLNNTNEKEINASYDETVTEEEVCLEEPMPVMRQDTFNLDHERIMKKIMKSIHKSRAHHRFQPNLAIDCEGIQSDKELHQLSANVMSHQERKVAMAKFVLNRKILKYKQIQNKYGSDVNILNHSFEQHVDHDGCESEYLHEEDYIEEDIEEQKHKSSELYKQ